MLYAYGKIGTEAFLVIMKMKITAKILMGAALAVPLLWVGTTLAEDNTTSTTNNNTTTEQKPVLSESEKKDLASRLQKRKDELKTKLNAVEQQRIKTKCTNSQGKLSSVAGKVNGIETSRTEVYGGLVARLSLLSSRLQNQGVDNTALQTTIDGLKAKIDVFNTDLATYKQAVTDLRAMDCVADPVAYKASLDAARAALVKLQEDAKAVRAYVTDTVKPTLAQIRKQL
jgi:hypothetical protein